MGILNLEPKFQPFFEKKTLKNTILTLKPYFQPKTTIHQSKDSNSNRIKINFQGFNLYFFT
jgi:hypothetical protein